MGIAIATVAAEAVEAEATNRVVVAQVGSGSRAPSRVKPRKP